MTIKSFGAGPKVRIFQGAHAAGVRFAAVRREVGSPSTAPALRFSTASPRGAEGAFGGPPSAARGPRALPGFLGHALRTPRACLALGLSAALLSLGVSCGKESSARRESVTADDVRGEPINAPAGTDTAASAGPTAQTVAAARVEPPATSPAAPAAAHAAQERSNEPLTVGFDKLASFTYEMPDESNNTNQVSNRKSESQIPNEIRALDKK